MKYKTMEERNSFKDEIEMSSEYSQFEGSGEGDSETHNILPTTGIYSEGGTLNDKAFPKLTPEGPSRKKSCEMLNNVPPLFSKFKPRQKISFRNQFNADDVETDENPSVRSRNEIQREHLIKMLKLIFHFSWLVIFCICIAATPPLLIRLPGDNMYVLMTWKLQIALLIFIPLAILELRTKESVSINIRFTYIKKLVHILIASLAYLLWLMGLLEACRNSIIMHAILFNNVAVFLFPLFSKAAEKYLGVPYKVGLTLSISGI
jgi:hypothetical protein